jgi:hypothetical protein
MGATFGQLVQNNLRTVSSFALYLVAPYYLNLNTLNYYNELLREPKMEEKEYILAQKGQKEANAYAIRVLQVSLLR